MQCVAVETLDLGGDEARPDEWFVGLGICRAIKISLCIGGDDMHVVSERCERLGKAVLGVSHFLGEPVRDDCNPHFQLACRAGSYHSIVRLRPSSNEVSATNPSH